MRKPRTTEEEAGRLYAVFAELWPDEYAFDEYSIVIRARDCADLRLALEPLEIGYRKDGRPRRSAGSRIDMWLADVGNKQFGALLLGRDEVGWCRMKKVPT